MMTEKTNRFFRIASCHAAANYGFTLLCLTISLWFLAGCDFLGQRSSRSSGKDQNIPDNTLTRAEQEAGWILLFDGRNLNGWRGYNKTFIPSVWVISDGALHCKAAADRQPEDTDGDLLYDEMFENFELMLEWKVAPGGNSGLFYLVREDPEMDIWQVAPEMQILDNELNPDTPEGLHSAGALYDILGVPRDKVKPAGQWNQVKLVVNQGHVEHWLNGELVVQYQLWTPEWQQMVARSKFPRYNPRWAEVPRQGFIGLQDRRDAVWFKNIKVRKLSPGS